MDSPLIVVVAIAAIVALIVLAVLLPRWIRRTGAAAGARESRRIRDARLIPILAELGTTLRFAGSERSAREVVDEVARQDPRRYTILPDGGYGIRFVEPDDAVARLVADRDGARLGVEGFREHLGVPNTAEAWRALRTRAASEAAARGIDTVEDAARRAFRRGEGPDAAWTIAPQPHTEEAS